MASGIAGLVIEPLIQGAAGMRIVARRDAENSASLVR